MNNGKFSFILSTIIQTLCDNIKKYFNITYNEAIELLYKSKLYEKLEKEDTKMWYYSEFDLFRMFVEETKTGDYTVYGG